VVTELSVLAQSNNLPVTSALPSLPTMLEQTPSLIFQQIVECAEEGVWVVDQQWCTVYVNARLTEMFGCAASAIIGHPITDFMDDEGRENVRGLMQRREAGIRESHEFRFVRCDGGDLWVWIATNPLVDGSGAFVGAVAMLADITDRKRIEEALCQHEAKLLALLENSPDDIWAVDRNYRLILGNSTFDAHCQAVVGRRLQPGETVLAELISAAVRAEWQAYYDRALAGEHFSVEVTTELAVEPRFMDYHFYPMRDENGAIMGVAVSGRDMTESKRTTRIIEARLRMIAFADAHTLCELLQRMIDEAEVLAQSNIGFFHFVDSDQQSLTLQTWSTRTLQKLCAAEGAGLHYTVNEAGLWVECIRQQRPLIVNDVASAPGRKGWPPGHAAVTRLMTAPILRNGLIVGVMGVGNRASDYALADLNTFALLADSFWEIVQAKRAEEELLAAHAALEQRVEARTTELRAANAGLTQALRVKDEFLANMSHELRTPLNAIITLAEVLKEEIHGPLNPRQARSAELIGQSGQHLLELINAVLDLSRMEAGIAEINFDVVDANLICALSLRFVWEAALKKMQRLDFIPAPSAVMIQADARRLRQILINLLANAVKFTPEGGAISLELQPDAQEQVVRFVVTDNGIGVATAQCSEIFQPFYQVDSGLARHYEGAGLGLALVKRLTELHGGQVDVTSEGVPGKGSRFVVTLPWGSATAPKAANP